MNDTFPFSLETPAQTAESSSGGDSLNAATSAAMASAAQSKRGRGRPRKDGAIAGGIDGTISKSPRISSELRAEMARQLDALYDPKAWGSLLSMPADTALAITGKDRWKVSDDERKTLGSCGSVAARFVVFENPKTLALLMLSSALFSVYVPRATAELKEQIAARNKENSLPKPDAAKP